MDPVETVIALLLGGDRARDACIFQNLDLHSPTAAGRKSREIKKLAKLPRKRITTIRSKRRSTIDP